MVVQNGFEVKIYDPDTDSLYEELTKDGNVYIEVSPDAQYFIQVELVNQGGWPRVKSGKALACITIDKQDLGYGKLVSLNGGAKRAGIATKEGDRALKFVMPRLNVDAKKAGPDPMAPLFGEIVVDMYETWLTTYMAPVVSPSSSSSASSAGSTNSDAFPSEVTMKVDVPEELKDAKVMRSTEGTAMLPGFKPPKEAASPAALSPLCGKKYKPSFQLESKYEWGSLITSIRLRYCSTVGLIVAGVIPKPSPTWTPKDAVAARAPAASLPSFDHSKVVSQKINYQDDNGMAHEAMQYDLTGLSDDEDGTK